MMMMAVMVQSLGSCNQQSHTQSPGQQQLKSDQQRIR